MIQSISDIITNSSSEVFIVQTDDAEKLKTFFEELINYLGYNLYDIMYIDIMYDKGKINWNDNYITYLPGDLCIESVSDNTIPETIMCVIENLEWCKPPVLKDITITNVDRMHLG